MEYLKQATRSPASADSATGKTVAALLEEIERDGKEAVRRCNEKFDGWTGEVIVPRTSFDDAARQLPDNVKDDLNFAHQRVSDFALAQRESIQEFETSLSEGLIAGQRLIPVETAGCYVPGGRYAHAASAIMSIGTAQAAGVANIIAATPAHETRGIHPAILYAMDICGVSTVLAAGGVQGIAALAFGLFTGHKADIIVGPGNRFVAEAKRTLFGQVGIDVVAGPTESLVIADATGDPEVIAADLAGQAEHGADSPVWLITTSRDIGEQVLEIIRGVIDALPEPARTAASSAWRDFGEIVIADDRDEACTICDNYAPEHLHVQAETWMANLKNYCFSVRKRQLHSATNVPVRTTSCRHAVPPATRAA